MLNAPLPLVNVIAKVKQQANILKLDVYNGNCNHLALFFMQCRNYFKFNKNLFDTSNLKVIYAITYFRGSA